MSPQMEFHPYATGYPPLEDDEHEALKADIANNGVREPVKFRLVDGKKQYLDGRNRLRACDDLGIPCPVQLVEVEDAHVEDYIDSLNLHRRHLTREQKRERIARKLTDEQTEARLAALESMIYWGHSISAYF